jgi:hypothetical protein
MIVTVAIRRRRGSGGSLRVGIASRWDSRAGKISTIVEILWHASAASIGELTEQMRESGLLVRNGGKRVSVTDDDSEESVSSKMTLDDLGINRNIAAAGVKRAVTDNDSATRCHPM